MPRQTHKQGYVKLWRKTLESGILKNPKAFALFGYLLLKVTHQATKYQNTVLYPGEYLRSLTEVGMELRLTRQELRTAVKFLESLEVIITEPGWDGRVATKFKVLNWSKYQAENNGKIQPWTDDEIGLEAEEISEAPQQTQPTVNHLQSSMNKNERTFLKDEKKGNVNSNYTANSKGAPPQGLKAALGHYELHDHLINFYPRWDTRSPHSRGASQDTLSSRRQEWVHRFNQEPIALPNFDVQANARGEYGDVMLCYMWEDLRGQELARRLQS